MESVVALRIRLAREAAGLSQTDMGKKLGLTKAGYGHYERGRQPFTVDMLFQLARILGRPVEHFLGLETGLTGREERVLALFRMAESAGYGDLVIGVVHASVAQLLTLPGQVSDPVSEKA